MPHDKPLDIFAITAPGLEPLCAAELSALGIPAVASDGGVAWKGSIESVARANLWLRTASRVVVRVAEFKAKAFFELELQAKKIEWQRWLASGSSVEFRVTCRKSKLYHSDAVAQRFGEAVKRKVKGVRVVEGGDDGDDGESRSLASLVMTASGKPLSPPPAPSGKPLSPPPAPSGKPLSPPPAPSGGPVSPPPTTSDGPVAPRPTPSGGPGFATQPQLFIVRFLHDVCTVSVD